MSDDSEGLQILPSGRVRLRFPDATGKRRHVGTYDSCETAVRVRNDLRAARAKAKAAGEGVPTLRSFGEAWLKRREVVVRVSDPDTDRGRWERHVLSARFADWPLSDIRAPNVRAWLDKLAVTPAFSGANRGKPVSHQTRKHALNLLRSAMQAAFEAGHVKVNPASGFKIEKRRHTHEPWTYLLPEEQKRLETCGAIPEPVRIMIVLAMRIGWRLGEFANMELVDVHIDGPAPHLIIRYGGPCHRPTKGGRPRKIPLAGPTLATFKRWIEVLPAYTSGRNPLGLVFPTVTGRRIGAKAPRWWEAARGAAGLDDAASRHDGRRVRFHDLRHTCASSLVAGWWGRQWPLGEVQKLLGHSSITVTQRYAHLADSVLQTATEGTTGGPGFTPSAPPSGHGPDISNHCALISGTSHRASKPLVAGSSPAGRAEGFRVVSGGDARANVPRVSRAELLRAIAEKSPVACDLARRAADEYLAAGPAADALSILRGDAFWAEAAVRLADALPTGLEEAAGGVS